MLQLDLVHQNLRVLRNALVVSNQHDAEQAAFSIVKNMFESAPTLGLDLDGTITESLEFFRLLSNVWPGAVVVVTYRTDYTKTVIELDRYGIHFDKLVLVAKLDKSQVIVDNKIDVYVDDQDECLVNIPPSVTVLKIRNGGNSQDGKWCYSNATGCLV